LLIVVVVVVGAKKIKDIRDKLVRRSDITLCRSKKKKFTPRKLNFVQEK
jgi:hypothetical protein